MRFIGRREAVGRGLRERMDWAEEMTAANERITLFVAFNYGGRAEIVDAARSFEGGCEEEFRDLPLRARDARPRPPDPHQRRAADLELPALAVRLLGARLPRRALARLRARGVRGGAGRVRRPAAGGSEGADGGLAPVRLRARLRPAAPQPPVRAAAAARARRKRRARRDATARRPSPGSPGRCPGSRSWSRSRSSAASCFAAAMIGFACVGIDEFFRMVARRAPVRDRRLRRRRGAGRRRLLRRPVPDDDRARRRASR